MVKADRDTGRLGRGARRQRVVDHDEAAPLPDLTSNDPAQRRDQAEQPEPFEHPVVGLPSQPRRQNQDRLRDIRRQQGADDQFQKRQPRSLRAGLHDLTDPSAKGRRESWCGSMASSGVWLHTRYMATGSPATPSSETFTNLQNRSD